MARSPEALEAEVALLGAFLTSPSTIPVALPGLESWHFQLEQHRRLFRAVAKLAERELRVDAPAVRDLLKSGGELEQLVGSDPVAAIERWAALVHRFQRAAPLSPDSKSVDLEAVGDLAGRIREAAQWRQLIAEFPGAALAFESGSTYAETLAIGQQRLQELGEAIGSEMPPALPLGQLPPEEPVRFSTRGLILAADLNLVVGDGGVGKTTLLVQLAVANVAGRPALDHLAFYSARGPILFISEEDSAGVLRNRALALARGHGYAEDAIDAGFHVLAREGAALEEPVWQAHILAEAKRIHPVAIFLDPHADLTPSVPENSNDDQKPVIRYLRRLAGESGAAIVTSHHAGKAGEGKRKIDRVRGASAIFAAARAVHFLDQSEFGIRVEPLKFNRGQLPGPFVVTREVEVDEANPGEWVSARFRYLTTRTAEQSSADRWVLEQLELAGPGQLNTSDLKKAASKTEHTAPQVSAAISRLQDLKMIDFEKGARGAKLWHLTTLPSNGGQPGSAHLAPPCPQVAPGKVEGPSTTLPSLRRRAGGGQGAGTAGQGELTQDQIDALEEENEALLERDTKP